MGIKNYKNIEFQLEDSVSKQNGVAYFEDNNTLVVLDHNGAKKTFAFVEDLAPGSGGNNYINVSQEVPLHLGNLEFQAEYEIYNLKVFYRGIRLMAGSSSDFEITGVNTFRIINPNITLSSLQSNSFFIDYDRVS